MKKTKYFIVWLLKKPLAYFKINNWFSSYKKNFRYFPMLTFVTFSLASIFLSLCVVYGLTAAQLIKVDQQDFYLKIISASFICFNFFVMILSYYEQFTNEQREIVDRLSNE